MMLILYGMLNLNFQPLLFCLYKINRLLVNANFEASCMHRSAGMEARNNAGPKQGQIIRVYIYIASYHSTENYIDDCMHVVTLVLQISRTKENGSCMSANCCTKVLLCMHVTKARDKQGK